MRNPFSSRPWLWGSLAVVIVGASAYLYNQYAAPARPIFGAAGECDWGLSINRRAVPVPKQTFKKNKVSALIAPMAGLSENVVAGIDPSLAFTSRKKGDGFVTEIDLDEARKARLLQLDFRWLQEDRFVLTDSDEGPGDPKRQIRFAGKEKHWARFEVPVESCPSWRGLSSHKLYLYHQKPQQIEAIRLRD